jgi:hypothetical protein
MTEGTVAPSATAYEGVRRTLADYCHTFDGGRIDEWLALFADEGVFSVDLFGELHGRTNIGRFISVVWQQLETYGLSGCNHITANELISVNGDRATSESYFLLVLPAPGGFSTPVVGRYHDRLIHDGQRWQFECRQLSWFNNEPSPAFAAMLRPAFEAQRPDPASG